MFRRRMTSNRVDDRCDILTPKQSPVSRSCDLTEEMPSSVESGAGPSIRGGSWGMPRAQNPREGTNPRRDVKPCKP